MLWFVIVQELYIPIASPSDREHVIESLHSLQRLVTTPPEPWHASQLLFTPDAVRTTPDPFAGLWGALSSIFASTLLADTGCGHHLLTASIQPSKGEHAESEAIRQDGLLMLHEYAVPYDYIRHTVSWPHIYVATHAEGGGSGGRQGMPGMLLLRRH